MIQKESFVPRVPQLAFTEKDFVAAYREWGCNCGPSALAAITGLTLAGVRPHMGDFESKGYTNPTLMFAALRNLGIRFGVQRPQSQVFADFGLVRVQWAGPWLAPDVPPQAAYRKTHWIATARGCSGYDIFDCNAGWCLSETWQRDVVPRILASCVPGASGGWYSAHLVEIAELPQWVD